MLEKLVSGRSYWTKEEAESYERSTSMRKIQQEMTRSIIEEIGNEGDVLDIGCGTGFSMEMTGKGCFGIDVSHEMIKIARSKGFERTAVADFRELPFRDSSFDRIISVSTLQWVTGSSPEEVAEQYRAAFREMRRVLRKGGRMGIQLYPHTPKEQEIVMKELSKLFSGYVKEEGEGKKMKRYIILRRE